jgi:antitoxin component YwqK of YwqJK toxin-antitoxin module
MRTWIVLLMWFFAVCSAGCEERLTFDPNGVARGTGERTYTYASGQPKLREDYVDGKLVRSRWFAPDGTPIQETFWRDGTGEGLYLREDGSIQKRVEYVRGLSHGNTTNTTRRGASRKWSGFERASWSRKFSRQPRIRSERLLQRPLHQLDLE